MLLKANMVVCGFASPNRADAGTVAARTIEGFKRTIPASMPGVVFLSEGQNDDEATLNPSAISLEASR